ncbi:MAG: hypothetical protein ACLP50_03005 [Solirubrobacteraceae bacterium]
MLDEPADQRRVEIVEVELERLLAGLLTRVERRLAEHTVGDAYLPAAAVDGSLVHVPRRTRAHPLQSNRPRWSDRSPACQHCSAADQSPGHPGIGPR